MWCGLIDEFGRMWMCWYSDVVYSSFIICVCMFGKWCRNNFNICRVTCSLSFYTHSFLVNPFKSHASKRTSAWGVVKPSYQDPSFCSWELVPFCKSFFWNSKHLVSFWSHIGYLGWWCVCCFCLSDNDDLFWFFWRHLF